MTNLENRVIRLERLVQGLDDKLRRLTDLVTRLAQNARVTAGGGGMPSGGGGDSVWFLPSGAVIASAGSTTADVYTTNAGTNILVEAGATIWNPYGVATTGGKLLTVGRNSDGSYLVIGQSC